MNFKANNTPVRTCESFGINDVKFENFDLPTNLDIFKNVEIESTKSKIVKNSSREPLTFGNGKIIEENVFSHFNNEMKIEAEDKDIKIIYNFDDENCSLVNNLEIIGKKDCNIIIEYKSKTNSRCIHNGIIRVVAEENVKINISIVNLMNNSSINFESIENKLEKNSKINFTIIDLGAKQSIVNYFSSLNGDNSSNDLRSIYLGKDEEKKDINYISNLYGEKSIVNIDVQGALEDKSMKNFKGTIDFKKGCKKSKGDENEFCLLLSDKAKSKALPILLCTEEDVEGNHSTASGSVDNKELFYIMSRGLSYKEAIKLIVKSRFNCIIERIIDEEIKQEIKDVIDEKLN